MTFDETLQETVAKWPERTAFRLRTGPAAYRRVSYGEMYEEARRVGAALIDMGLQTGERVAILSENRPEWVVAYLAIYLAGGVSVPLDPQISGPEWRNLLSDSESRWVFVSALLAPKLDQALSGSQLQNKLIHMDEGDSQRPTLAGLGSKERADSIAFPKGHPSDVQVLIYTSGTTGKPKGVMLTRENVMAEITSALQVIYADHEDNFLCLLPLQHVLASVINVLIPLHLGAQVTFVDTLKRSEILAALEEAGITIMATVPQFFYLFYDRITEELSRRGALARAAFGFMLGLNGLLRTVRINLGKPMFRTIHRAFGSRMRMFVSGGSSFDPKVARYFHDLGFTILQGYGLTETTGACTVTRVEHNVLGSVGPPLPGVQINIKEPDDSGVGEILIKGPVVMKGYYRNPEATGEAIVDGWLRSGDLGRQDGAGNLFVTGRRKEVIVLANGKNIYPDELETHYAQCPYIQEIAVVGVSDPDDPQRGERLHAVVVPNFEYLKAKRIANAREIIRDEIGRWSNMLPKYKRLTSYHIQKDPLPRTTTRKIKRVHLKQLIESGAMAESDSQREQAPAAAVPDASQFESPVAQEIVRLLREDYGRTEAVRPDTNLELDLGFDSMERVEFLASIEQVLNITLPEDFGADIFTVGELVSRLETQAGMKGSGSGAQRQNWASILGGEALSQDSALQVRFSGAFVALFKYLVLRAVYVLCRIVLRLEVHGLERLPRAAPYLICPNHLSYLDPIVVMCVLPYRVFRRVFFVGASEYFTTWYMKLLARLANVVPVDPDVHLVRAMKVGAYGLRQNRILCIFPEGARSFDGELKEFKKGAAILAGEIGVPMVPVGIWGTYQAWARDSRRIRAHKVRIGFGPPLQTISNGAPQYQQTTDVLREAVAREIRSVSS